MSIPNLTPAKALDAANGSSNIRQTNALDNTGAFSKLMRLLNKTGNSSGEQTPGSTPFIQSNSTTDPVESALRQLTERPQIASVPLLSAPPAAPSANPASDPAPHAIRLPVDRTFLSPVEQGGSTGGASSATNATAGPETAANAESAKSGSAPSSVPGGVLWKYESGHHGAEAIGYDRHGGTSYGRYQISSRSGSMRRFVSYLKEKAPDLAARLTASGPSDTGGRSGRMPEEWRKITSEDPQRFESLQHDFIHRTHYEPARLKVLDKCGLDVEGRSPAMREVLWSMAVQHGPSGAARIFRNAVRPEDIASGKTDREIIKTVYDARIQRFAKASPTLRAALKSRYLREANQILETHDASSSTTI